MSFHCSFHNAVNAKRASILKPICAETSSTDLNQLQWQAINWRIVFFLRVFGDWKGADDVPKLVEEYLSGTILADQFITHTLPLERINEGFDLLRKGKSIRTVIVYP